MILVWSGELQWVLREIKLRSGEMIEKRFLWWWFWLVLGGSAASGAAERILTRGGYKRGRERMLGMKTEMKGVWIPYIPLPSQPWALNKAQKAFTTQHLSFLWCTPLPETIEIEFGLAFLGPVPLFLHYPDTHPFTVYTPLARCWIIYFIIVLIPFNFLVTHPKIHIKNTLFFK